jgi:hypothetical protein
MHTLNIMMHDIIKLNKHDCKWIGALYRQGKSMRKLITSHNHAHYIFCNHSKSELLKIAKNRRASYYFTFRCLFKVREELASMVSTDSWQGLKNRAASASDGEKFETSWLDSHILLLPTFLVKIV